MPELAIVIIAAGSSTRLGEAKQLIQKDGQTLLSQTIQLAFQVADKVNCVLGYKTQLLQSSIKLSRQQQSLLRIIHNPKWQSGMGTSIASGVQTLDKNVDAVMILLCDQWAIETSDLMQLYKSWQINPQSIVASRYQDRDPKKRVCGAPVIFPRQYFGELAKLDKTGARKLLNQYAANVIAIDLARAAHDIDTPEDLRKMQQHTGHSLTPNTVSRKNDKN